jgi:hypothetical protein
MRTAVSSARYDALMVLKRVVWFLLVAFLVFFLINSPAQAGGLVTVIGENTGVILKAASKALAQFVTDL